MSPGNGRYEPEKEDKLYFVVEGKPAAEHDVRDLLGDGEERQDDPVRHPVDIFLSPGVTTSDLRSYQSEIRDWKKVVHTVLTPP